jgi:hypothetical protein
MFHSGLDNVQRIRLGIRFDMFSGTPFRRLLDRFVRGDGAGQRVSPNQAISGTVYRR